MSLFEFLCGGLSALRSRRTTAYEIGDEVHIVTASSTRTLPDRKQVSTAMSDSSKSSRRTGEGLLAPGPSLRSDTLYHLPYGYGNPFVWLGGNVLARSLQDLGVSAKLPGEEDVY